MDAVPKLKQLIEEVAQKHDFDLYQTGAYLRLDLERNRLIIENIGARRISIAYQLFHFYDLITDPEVVVWIQQPLSEEEEPREKWIPTELYRVQGGWKACADFTPEGTMNAFYRPEWQIWLALFVETEIVSNLTNQRWLEEAVKSDEPPPSYTPEQMRERGYITPKDSYTDEDEGIVDEDIPF